METQIGVIVYGHGMNPRPYIEEAKAAGYKVLLKDGRTEIYSPAKK